MSLLDDVKARLEIVDVVSGYVPLAQSGRGFRARCPFHAERTPSFYVFPDRQTWRCFGACAEGGDAIGFVMKMENLGFQEALRLLARSLGVQAPSPRTRERLSPLQRVNEAAARFYHQHLLGSPEGVDALAYLEERGVSRETIAAFGLGLSPAGWEGLKGHLLAQGFPEGVPVEAGLLLRSPDGHTRDLFHGRLMFPIRDPAGHVAGFGGRSLDGGEPKYLNTPRTPVFDKGNLLYALDLAAEAIRREGSGTIVEGYMDAITAHQHGFRNVVAQMGTALTTQQVSLLVGLAHSHVLALDADAAGQEATLRSLETSWRVFQPLPMARGGPRAGEATDRGRAVRLRVAVLPQGRDPDEVIRLDPELWRQAVDGSRELLDFLFDVLPPRYNLSTPEGKLGLAERFGGLILSVEEPARQDQYLERLERLLGVDRPTLDRALGLSRRALLRAGRRRDGRREEVQGYAAPFARAAHEPLEEYTLALLLQNPSLGAEAQGMESDFFQRTENREVFNSWASCSIIEELKTSVDVSLAEHLQALLDRALPPMDLKERVEAFSHCLRRLEERRLRELTAQEGALLAQVQEEGDAEAEEAIRRLRVRQQRLREIFSTRVRKG